jgi:hypothetical protein
MQQIPEYFFSRKRKSFAFRCIARKENWYPKTQSFADTWMLLIYVVHSDVYFRKSGLEHSASVKKDLEWFGEQRVEYL